MLRSLPGHTFIDILKIDVEASEFDALTSFVNAHTHGDLPFGQLQLEIHAENDRANFEWFRGWWESLEAAGLRPFSLEPNLIHVTNPGCRKPFVVEVRLLVASFKYFFFLFMTVVVLLQQYSFINIRGNHALVSDAFN